MTRRCQRLWAVQITARRAFLDVGVDFIHLDDVRDTGIGRCCLGPALNFGSLSVLPSAFSILTALTTRLAPTFHQARTTTPAAIHPQLLETLLPTG